MVAGVTLLGLVVLGLVAVGGFVGVGLAVVAWRRRGTAPGARAYAALAAAIGGWCLGYAGLLASPPALAVDVFDPLVTAFANTVAFAWLLFAVEYTGHGDWLSRRRVAALLAEPAAFLALYATNPVHGWLVAGYDVARWQGLTLVMPARTAWTWLHIGLVYVVLLAGAGLVLAFAVRSRNVHRRQAAAILAGTLVAAVGNAVSLAGLAPHPALDLTPVAFVATGVVVAWALFRYEFLSVAPVARDAVVEAMDDPVVVLDDDDALLDYNPAAGRLGIDEDDLGRPIEEILRGLAAALSADGPVALRTEDGEECVYDPRPTTLTDRRGVARGRVVVLREVTPLKRREQALAALQSATRELMAAADDGTAAAVVVATAADALDHRHAGFLTHDTTAGHLTATTLTPSLERQVPDGGLSYGPGDHLVWGAFRAGEVVVVGGEGDGADGGTGGGGGVDGGNGEGGGADGGNGDNDGADDAGGATLGGLPVSSAVLLPVGDHGLLVVGSPDGRTYADDEVRFLEILASAAESALDRLARERETREHRDALAERNERLEEFASIVSHDLRTPLTTATGYLALARQDLDDEAGYLERVADSHDRMESLVEDLLALARQGQVVDETEPVPVGEVALNAWQTAGHVDAAFDLEAFPGHVVADRERVRTLLENLLGNAVEHGGTDVTVRVGPLPPAASTDGGAGGASGGDAAETTDGDAETVTEAGAEGVADGGDDVDATADLAGFYVEDDGPGIPEDEREAVLEQGYSGDTGTGLGLAIVARIADAHGWELTVTESDEGGARFEFTGIEPAE